MSSKKKPFRIHSKYVDIVLFGFCWFISFSDIHTAPLPLPELVQVASSKPNSKKKIWLITGAAGRLGTVIARYFLENNVCELRLFDIVKPSPTKQ